MPPTTPETDQTTRGLAAQLPRNLAANIAYFLVNIVIGVLLVPYFINTLGVAAYGIIPLATSMNGYVGLVTQALNTAVSRYLTVDLQREDYAKANKTFNTALFGISGIILLMVPIVILLSFFAPTIFNVPLGQETGAILLFLGVTCAFLIRSWSGNFTVSLFAYNRLDLLNLVNIVNVVVQVLLIVSFFSISEPSLALIGLAYLISGVVASVLAIFLSQQINPHLAINYHDFDRSRLYELSAMSWWVILAHMGSLLFSNIDLIVVNMIFGAIAGGEYAIALQWSILIKAIAGTLAGVMTPIILTYYAKGQEEMLIRVSRSSVKLLGLALALPIGLVCGLAPELLTIWVGEELSFLAPLIVVLIGPLTINMCVQPLFSINIAHNRVKIPGVLNLFMGIGNLLLAIILSLNTNWGYYGVAIAAAVVVTLRYAIFTPWYATRVLGVGVHTFTRSMLPGIVATGLIGIAAATLGAVLSLPALVTLAIAGAAISLVYLVVVWELGLNRFERGLFESFLPPALRRIIV